MSARWSRQAVAATVSAAIAITPALAQAQGAPGPALRPPPATTQAGDPPARVGRVALLSGTVSFHLAGADRWDAASLNLPVSTGSALWTEPGAKAAIDVTGTRLELAPSTELDMVQLDDSVFVTAVPQGEACTKIHGLLPNASVIIQTPRGQVSLTKDGHYDVAAGDTAHPTVITVVDGDATITGAGFQTQVGPNQAATINGDGQATPYAAAVAPAQRDSFLDACLAEDKPARPHVVQPPAAVAQMTGGYVLDEYGDWASTPDDGPIWFPPADPGYVPYRQGHWAYVAPWGWTWIDDAPWGFAPSHYGRWVQVQDRWGWIPGGGPLQPGYRAPAYPVYAPAVVSFLAGAAAGALAAHALDRGSVGWVPLGPHEPYYPPYRASANYVRNLNVTHVTNVNSVVNTYNTVINRPAARGAFNQGPQFGTGPLVNRAAATAIPAAAMAGSQNVAALARPVPAAALAGAAPLVARPPITPTASTFGLTPAVAQRYHIQAPVARPAAPGPAIRPTAAPGFAGRPAALSEAARPLALPGLRPAGEPQPGRPNGGAPGPTIEPRAPGVPPQREARPEAARPAAPRIETSPQRPAMPNVVHPGPGLQAIPRPASQPMPHVIQPSHETAPARSAPSPAAPPPVAPPHAAPPPRPEPHPEPRPEPRPQPQPQPRPAPPPQAHPAPHPAPRPAPAPHEERRP